MAKSRDKKKLPRQPVLLDKAGCPRFRENKLVRYLLDNGGIDLNHLATKKFPKEDWQQFAQLIGYSRSRAPWPTWNRQTPSLAIIWPKRCSTGQPP